MKKYGKLLLLALLALAALGLCACGGGDTAGGEDGSGTLKPADDGYTYVASYVTPEGMPDNFNGIVYGQDGMIYFYASQVVGMRESLSQEEIEQYAQDFGEGVTFDWMFEIYGTVLYKINRDGSGLTKLENYELSLPEGFDSTTSSANLERMAVDGQGNLAVVESISSWSYDSEDKYQNSTTQYRLRTLDATGAETGSTDLTELTGQQEYFYISGLLIDDQGNLYLADGDSGNVYVFDQNSQLLFTISGGNYVESLQLLADGSIGAVGYGDNGMCLTMIDLEKQDWGDSIDLPAGAWNIYVGQIGYDFFYNEGGNLVGYQLADKSATPLLNWIDCDVDSDGILSLTQLDENSFLAISQTYTADGSKCEFITLTRTPSDQVKQKETLTLACYYLDSNIRSQVIEFNKTNPDYRISVTEYSGYDTEDDYTAGLTKLTTEIVTGNVPDLLLTSNLPVSRFASQGLLEDLLPYLDSDPTLSREDMVASVLNILSQDGGLYQVGPTFSLMTVFAATSLVGEEMGWTIAELNDLMAAHPEAVAFAGVAQADILQYMCMFNMEDFVDWSTGECHFDSEEFIGLLNFCSTFPSAIDWEKMYADGTYEDTTTLIQEGRALLNPASLYDISDLNYQKAIFGTDVTAIGFPTAQGVGTRITLDMGLAITTSCRDKDAAWSFVRTFLTKEYQEENAWGMPTNQAMLEERVKKAQQDNAGGGGVAIEGGGSIEYSNHFSAEDTAKFYAIIDSASGMFSYDVSMTDIIMEEAASFFAGEKTAEECAQLVQSRMNIYVNEQR